MTRQAVHGRVRWAETDASGLFHYTHVFRWVEVAETELWRRLGRLELVALMPRRSVEAELLRPLSFDDEYEAILSLERVGFTSITWAFEIVSSGECHVRGRVVAVNVDDQGRSTALTDDVRELLRSG